LEEIGRHHMNNQEEDGREVLKWVLKIIGYESND
jgi:hypothetical protein